MLKRIKNLDSFTRNILIAFTGTSLVSFLNLLFQLLIAHKLNVSEFGAFNSLVAVLLIVSGPLSTLQIGVAKFCSEYNLTNQFRKQKAILSNFLKVAFFLFLLISAIFLLFASRLNNAFKISSVSSGFIFAFLVGSSALLPVFVGGVQGLERFGWFSFGSIVSSLLKLVLGLIFVVIGFGMEGALNAWLAANIFGIIVFYFVLRPYVSFKSDVESINIWPKMAYLLPVALSALFFMVLVSSDMVLVKYYFSESDSGIYSLAQMVGKIFLFLPMAVSLVLLPRASSLNAAKSDTLSVLRKSILFGLFLAVSAGIFYNLFPAFVLKILTGKVYPLSLQLSRYFCFSMSFFALVNIMMFYFLSIEDFRFIKYMVISGILQISAITIFRQSLVSVQLVLCMNSLLLFFCLAFLAFKRLK